MKGIIINSTLGKALGGMSGGYTTGPSYIIDILRQRSRPYLFSNAIAPVIAGTTLKVLELMNTPATVLPLMEKLAGNTRHFRTRMQAAGFEVRGHPSHPICPVMFYDAKVAAAAAEALLQQGLYCVAFSYPVVPHGQARIRLQVSAGHSQADLDHTVDAFVAVAKALGIKLTK